MQRRKTYNFREPCQTWHERRRRLSRSIYSIQHEHEARAIPTVGVLEHPAQLNVKRSQRLTAPRHTILGPVNRLRDRRDDSLEEVPGGDALRRVDDGVPQRGDVGGEVAQEGARDGGLARGFDAVKGEVAAWCGVGLEGAER